MKTFNQFKQDMNEGKVNLLKGAIKFLAKGVKKYPVAGAVGMGAGTGINYLLIKNSLKKRKPKLDKDSEKFLNSGEFQEGVATLAIPAGVGILKKIATSSALKYAGAGALTGAGYLAAKKINQDKGEEEIQQRKRAEEEEVGKAIGKNPGEPLPKIRKRDIIKQEFQKGFKKYKEGLSVKPEDVKGKKYRTPEMGNESPADYVRRLQQELKNRLKRQKNAYKRQRIKNKRIDKDLGK